MYREYVLDVRIVETVTLDGEPIYRVEVGGDVLRTFDDPETAALYADVYFCVNGFEEAGTGDRGIPPEIVSAGRAVLAAYFLTQPRVDQTWVASFFGTKPHRIREYADHVRERATQIREGVATTGPE